MSLVSLSRFYAADELQALAVPFPASVLLVNNLTRQSHTHSSLIKMSRVCVACELQALAVPFPALMPLVNATSRCAVWWEQALGVLVVARQHVARLLIATHRLMLGGRGVQDISTHWCACNLDLEQENRITTLKRRAARCTMSGGTWHCKATSSAKLSVLLPGIILQVGTLPPIPAPKHAFRACKIECVGFSLEGRKQTWHASTCAADSQISKALTSSLCYYQEAFSR